VARGDDPSRQHVKTVVAAMGRTIP
jgi:hypothetical protein